MTPWWLSLPEAQATIDCGEQTHRLRWQQGDLQAVDHEDIEAERTLAALGDQRCACADVLDAWARHASDLRVLVLASRGPTDPLAIQADQAASPSAPIARPRRPGRSRPGRRASGIAFLATRAGPGGTRQSAAQSRRRTSFRDCSASAEVCRKGSSPQSYPSGPPVSRDPMRPTKPHMHSFMPPCMAASPPPCATGSASPTARSSCA